MRRTSSRRNGSRPKTSKGGSGRGRRNGASEDSPQDYLRLPARLRLKFEEELGGSTGKKTGKKNFEHAFERDIDSYYEYIKGAVKCAFDLLGTKLWFNKRGVDIVTWHYKTRHSTYEAAEATEWFSGQISFNSKLNRRADLEPFPGKKSPYIYIFGNEQSREKKRVGGPICILLSEKNQPSLEEPEEWKHNALIIPADITKELKCFPPHNGDKDPLSEKHLKHIKKINPEFIRKLAEWMNKVSIEKVDDLKALNNLLASLKVTLKLLSDRSYKCSLPRSTFLCPAYVAGEEVGGMAFACDGFVSSEVAILGDAVTTALLSYLRLREDALAHNIIEEKTIRDQTRNFFIHRLVHDFRHPIDALQSTVRDLSRSLNGIGDQIAHVSEMMDDMVIAFDEQEPERILKAHKSPDKVSEFIADVRFFFRRRVEENGKHLEVNFNEINPSWVFNIDRSMIHEIMENLIANALEHGGQNIKIEVEKKAGKYFIHVMDDGKGVPEKDQEIIFRPFAKISISMNENPNRGRGLAISKKLAEIHKGDLRLKSGTGKWKTDFILEIPEK